MTSAPFSRRHFLALGGGAVLLAACGSKAGSTAGSGGNGAFTDVSPGIVSMDLYVDPEPQRFAFALLAKQGYASGKPVRVAIAPPGSTPSKYVAATARSQGLPEFRGVYSLQETLDAKGVWRGYLDYGGHINHFVFQVNDKPSVVVAGDDAPRVASPTIANPLGVDPICTRTPPCPLHTISLDKIIGKGKPVAVMFATPARCQTQYCGPVLDTMLGLRAKYDGKIDFVHVEIYQNNQTTDVISTVADWKLPGEPWLFGVDGAGKVTSRLDGAFDKTEIQGVLDGLVRA